MEKLGLPAKDREREAAILFAACPACLVGDLAIRRVGDDYIAACLQCGHVGLLRTTYPPIRAPSRPINCSASRTRAGRCVSPEAVGRS